MPHPSSNQLAEKIAKLIESESRPSESDARQNTLSAMLESINAMQKRLDRLEASIGSQPSVQPLKSAHPSTERFAIAEAIADEIFSGIQKEKACTFEPNGKPCDHCSMCSSRGF